METENKHIFLNRIKATQGGFHHHNVEKDDGITILCSECFKDDGLKIEAYNIGIPQKGICPNCKSKEGHKLTKKLLLELCHKFFVRGTIKKVKYGGYPIIQFNESHSGDTELKFYNDLKKDVKLLEKTLGINFFHYSPRWWMFGEITPLKDLQNKKKREVIINKIFKAYPTVYLSKKHHFYRLRTSPKNPQNILEYDSPPSQNLGKNRFDSKNLPILYTSPDLELCLHECRAKMEDSIFVAKLFPKRKLKLLNLSALIEEKSVTEFESLDLAIHFLFLSGKCSYKISRAIALLAKENGYDGIIYPSYFSYIRTGYIPFDTVYGMSIRRIPQLKDYAQNQTVPNIALFGRPIQEKKVFVDCINKVIINRIKYDLSFGPILD